MASLSNQTMPKRKRKKINLVFTSFLFFCAFYQKFSSNLLLQIKEEKTKHLADGCYHVFLDVGSNIGMHGRFVFEPNTFSSRSGKHKKMMRIFDENFGRERGIEAPNSNNGNICIFAFEPNPEHVKRHVELQMVYKKFGLRYHPVPMGVSDQDAYITFYHQDNNPEKYGKELGFSAAKKYQDQKKATEKNVTIIETKIEVIRLSRWLKENIYQRSLPDKKFALPPKVLMKLDVEGMEYILLPDLFLSGILCQTVDVITTELHFKQIIDIPPNSMTGRGGIKLNSKDDRMKLANGLFTALHSLRNNDCLLKRIEMLDDESYFLDGHPYPEPKNN